MPASCQLYDLVLDMDWSAVEKHAKDQPEDAAFEDGESRETPLYLACQLNPPLVTVSALIEAYPEAIRLPRKNGNLPLHIACRYLADTDVLHALVQREPSTVFWSTKYGRTPFTALADAYARRVETIRSNTLEEHQREEILTLQSSVNSRIDKLLTIAALGLPEFQDENGKLLKMHVALKTDALDERMWENHKDFAQLTWSLVDCGQSMTTRDGRGRLPLHIAAHSGHPASRRINHTILQRLLERHPKQARAPDPSQGDRLALHIMAANPAYTWSEAELVFRSAPGCLTVCDPVTGLLPFALAATVRGKNALNTSYMLLLARPDIISAYCVDKETSQVGTSPQTLMEYIFPYRYTAIRGALLAICMSAAVFLLARSRIGDQRY